MIEQATYNVIDEQGHRSTITIDYDTEAPCAGCGLPLTAASVAGPTICPWCDLGVCRFDRSHLVNDRWDWETKKFEVPRKHYERCHPEKFNAG